MAKYDNLASINLELLDGNLAANPPLTGPIALVIATALSGKSNTPYLMDDVNKAAAIFGANSALIKAANELKLGGAQTVALYRIGGVSASIAGLTGTLSEITSVEETVGVGQKYSVYIGPQPNDAGSACLIIFEGSKIVYSNVPGSEVDLGRFVIVEFDDSFTGRIGYPTAPVLLDDALDELKDDTTNVFTGSTGVTSFDLSGTSDPDTLIESVKIGTTLQAPSTYNISIGTGTAGADEIVFTVAPANGSTVTVVFSRPLTVVGATYRAGADNVGATYKKLYELIDAAFLDLETTVATHVVIPEAINDAANIADGSSASNRLEYVLRTEVSGDLTWTWSTVKKLYAYSGLVTDATHDATANTTSVLADADLDANGQPIVAKTFSETNFTHRLGEFCADQAENDKFIFGIIGTSQPVASTTKAVNAWLGSLPTVDAEGSITANGTGLLGNRYMAGSTSQVPGFYKTDSGYPDGNVVYDNNGAPVDLGKFLSVVAAVVSTPRAPIIGMNTRTINASSIYAGVLTTVTPGNSTTNLQVNRLTLPFLVKKTKVNEIAGAGYVMFMDKGTNVVCASGELPTGPASDYDYVSTSITIADVTNRIRERLDPFLGKGLNEVRIGAMQTAIDAEFQKSVDAGAIIKYGAQVILESVVNGKGRVKVPYVVVPAFELREVNQSLVLAYDI